MILELNAVTRRFGQVTAVDRLSLGMEEGEFVTLLGPSGCGKTTALRLIAGFETPDEGQVLFRGREVAGQAPQARGFGMVFQNYALFPHLDVFENVAFGLRSRGTPRAAMEERVRTSLARVDLEGYGDRPVQSLSGGQQQRVALARALAIEPPILLLDEPLSNLDRELRIRTRAELRALVKEMGITALFVTHDQEEAFDLSDRIAVMRDGRLRQIGPPTELYREPVDPFVAGFVGQANFLPVEVEEGADSLPGSGSGAGGSGTSGGGSGSEGGSRAVRLPGGEVWSVPELSQGWSGPGSGRSSGSRPPSGVQPGSGIVLLVRPEELRFAGDSEDGAVEGVVRDRRFRGPITTYRVETAGMELEVVHSADGPQEGDRVRLLPRPDARLHLLPSEPKGGGESEL